MDGDTVAVKVDQLYIGVLFVNEVGEVVETMSATKNNVVPALTAYSWATWQVPKYNERL